MPAIRKTVIPLAIVAGLTACVDTPASGDSATVAPGVAAPPQATIGGGPTLALINAQRQASGLSPVAYSAQLQRAADAHVRWMAQTGNLTHDGNGGSSIKSRIRSAGFCTGAFNENIASGQATPQSVVTAWMGSAPHRRNILARKVDHAAVASTRDSSGTVWWAMKMGEAC